MDKELRKMQLYTDKEISVNSAWYKLAEDIEDIIHCPTMKDETKYQFIKLQYEQAAEKAAKAERLYIEAIIKEGLDEIEEEKCDRKIEWWEYAG